jgi:hypothetical protein
MWDLLNIPHLHIFICDSLCYILSKYPGLTDTLYQRMSFPDISIKSREIWQDVACCMTILSMTRRQDEVERIYSGMKKLPVPQYVPLIQFRLAQGLDGNLKQFQIIKYEEHCSLSFVTAILINLFLYISIFCSLLCYNIKVLGPSTQHLCTLSLILIKSI